MRASIVFLLLHVFAVQNDAQDICTSVHGFNCYGNDLNVVSGVRRHEDCCQACKDYKGCNAWTWNYKTSACYLKSGCDDKRPEKSCHSGAPPAPPTPSGQCTSVHGFDCYGNDLNVVSGVRRHEDCCQACKDYKGCNAWTWNYETSACYLKSGCDDKRPEKSCHSGAPPAPPTPSGQCGGAMKDRYYAGGNLCEGGDHPHAPGGPCKYAADAEECCAICGSTPGCVRASLYKGVCFTKDDTSILVAKSGSITIRRSRPQPRPRPRPQPTPQPTPQPRPRPQPRPCLCLFDIDETLTGHHSMIGQCPKDVPRYLSGYNMQLSDAAVHLSWTFCHDCYLGVISAGGVRGSGSEERAEVVKTLNKGGKLPTDQWNPDHGCTNKGSPLIVHCSDKPLAVPGILRWYQEAQGVQISPKDVYFFDDKEKHIKSFESSPYNAHQISCPTHGNCGAEVHEIRNTAGISYCSGGSRDHYYYNRVRVNESSPDVVV